MKVIDLYNKIANGEEVPNVIEYATHTYFNVGERENSTYQNENGYLWYEINEGRLNDEIKILDDDYLEETKKEDLINHLVNDCGCVIEDIPKPNLPSHDYGKGKVYPKEKKKIEPLDLQYKDIIYNPNFKANILMYCDNLQCKINEIINKHNMLVDKVNGENNEKQN